MAVIPFKAPQIKSSNGHSNDHSLQAHEKLKKIARDFSERVDAGVVRSVYLFEIDNKSKPRAVTAYAPEDRGIAYAIAQTVRDIYTPEGRL